MIIRVIRPDKTAVDFPDSSSVEEDGVLTIYNNDPYEIRAVFNTAGWVEVRIFRSEEDLEEN
jgi:hypothetical protein